MFRPILMYAIFSLAIILGLVMTAYKYLPAASSQVEKTDQQFTDSNPKQNEIVTESIPEVNKDIITTPLIINKSGTYSFTMYVPGSWEVEDAHFNANRNGDIYDYSLTLTEGEYRIFVKA